MSPDEFFYTNLETLFHDHPDQWVAVSDSQVVAVAPSFAKMMAAEPVRHTRVELVYAHLDSKTTPALIAARKQAPAAAKAKGKASVQPDKGTDHA